MEPKKKQNERKKRQNSGAMKKAKLCKEEKAKIAERGKRQNSKDKCETRTKMGRAKSGKNRKRENHIFLLCPLK